MTNSSLPLVSIVIPVYNGSNYLREAINSTLAQTYENIEVIVVNDGSTDNGKTEKIAKSYGNKIRYFKKTNGGVSSAINYGIKKMRGEYFSWLSHDDLYMPNKVSAEINYLRENYLLHSKVIAFSDYFVVDKRGKLISELKINHELIEKHQIYAFIRGAVNGNSMLIPKKAWDDYGLLDTKLSCTQDYAKWFEMNKTYKFVHVPETLIKSRYHAGQTTNTDPRVRTEGNAFWLQVVKSFTPKMRKKLNGDDYTFYYYFIEYFKNTPYNEALSYCQEQIKNYPTPSEKPPKENLVKYAQRELFSKNKFIKFCQFIEREGLVNTGRRIVKKIQKVRKNSHVS